LVATRSGSAWKKLGQPVPLSNLASELKRGRKQAAQMKVPARFSPLRGLENDRSVDSPNRIAYRSAGRSFFHSALDFSRGWNPCIVFASAIDPSFDRTHAGKEQEGEARR
jgi:hypothetical protein